MTDTKQHWKRRALRAEEELEQRRRIELFHHNHADDLFNTNAALVCAFREIQAIINAVVKGE